MVLVDLLCPTCGASASIPLGVVCEDHRPVPCFEGSAYDDLRVQAYGSDPDLEVAYLLLYALLGGSDYFWLLEEVFAPPPSSMLLPSLWRQDVDELVEVALGEDWVRPSWP